MTTAPDGPIGLYFEDLTPGHTMVTRGRTITESDVVQFAALTGDYNPMHTDAHYAASTPFGGRVAHGMLTLSYAVGQAYQLGFMERTVQAFRGLEMTFSAPVKLGDTLRVHIEVAEATPMPRLKAGQVSFKVRVVNQDGQTVQKGTWHVLMASRPAAAAGGEAGAGR